MAGRAAPPIEISMLLKTPSQCSWSPCSSSSVVCWTPAASSCRRLRGSPGCPPAAVRYAWVFVLGAAGCCCVVVCCLRLGFFAGPLAAAAADWCVWLLPCMRCSSSGETLPLGFPWSARIALRCRCSPRLALVCPGVAVCPPRAMTFAHSSSSSSSDIPTRWATPFHVSESSLVHPLWPNAVWTAALNRFPLIL